MKQTVKNIIELPGLIDVHTHLREPGGTQKEDFETGTKAAVAGGYTQILDMPNNIPPTVDSQTLNEKIKLATGRIFCDVGFNFGAIPESTAYFKSIQKRVFGLKVYMNQTTGPLLVENQKDRDLIFKSWSSPLPIMAHAQGETVDQALSLAKKYKKSLHVCHVTSDQIKSIEKARKQAVNVTCEVCPHHLFLNKNDIKKLGPLGIMKPPLLSKKDQEKLWDNLDKIDMISSDHAPHTLEEKHDQSSPKFGVPGLETTLPLMLKAVSDRKLTISHLLEMTSHNPRKIFKLPAQKRTSVIVDVSKNYKITAKNLFTKCGWTPFEGMDARGEIIRVIIRGRTVFKSGKFIGNPSGKIIYPHLAL